jgi:predicted GIY-YIG superfamily endonuclease
VAYRVYVLRNHKGQMYIGFSENLAVRVQQHNSGMSRSTRDRGPWRVVWQSDVMNLAKARQLELQLKRQKGGNGFYQKTGLERS